MLTALALGSTAGGARQCMHACFKQPSYISIVVYVLTNHIFAQAPSARKVRALSSGAQPVYRFEANARTYLIAIPALCAKENRGLSVE